MEGISPLLYHQTYPNSAADILDKDELLLTAAIPGSSDHVGNKKKSYYLSTQRSKSGKTGYARGQGTVSFELDGKALMQNYSGHPIDYWGYSRDKTANQSPEDFRQMALAHELEDRVTSEKPSIPNAHKYIRGIYLLVPHVSYQYQNFAQDFERIVKGSQKYNIPLYIFDNKTYFNDRRIDKAIDPSTASLKKSEDTEERTNYKIKFALEDLVPVLLYRNQVLRPVIASLLPDGKIPDNWVEKLDRNDESPYAPKSASELASALHNHRRDSDPLIRKLIELYQQEFKKSGVKTVTEYIAWKEKTDKETKEPKEPGSKTGVRVVFYEDEGRYPIDGNKRIMDWTSDEDVFQALPEDFWRNEAIQKRLLELLEPKRKTTILMFYRFLLQHMRRAQVEGIMQKIGLSPKLEKLVPGRWGGSPSWTSSR